MTLFVFGAAGNMLEALAKASERDANYVVLLVKYHMMLANIISSNYYNIISLETVINVRLIVMEMKT